MHTVASRRIIEGVIELLGSYVFPMVAPWSLPGARPQLDNIRALLKAFERDAKRRRFQCSKSPETETENSLCKPHEHVPLEENHFR